MDQAEEAVTTCQDPSERERYFAALAAHVAAGGALVLSLRADHLGDLAPYPDIARILEDGLYLLGPMDEADLRSAIEGPARRAGLRLEPGLVDLLVRDVEGEPAALPLLSHVLRETWARREGPTLTVDGYRATGGIRDAVSRTAESLYDAMDDAAAQPAPQRPAAAGDAHRGRRPGAGPRAPRQGRRRRGAPAAARAAGQRAAGEHRRRHRADRARGAGAGLAAAARLAGRRRRRASGSSVTWPARPTPGTRWAGRRASSTGAPGWPGRWSGGSAAQPDLNDNEAAFLDASAALAETEVRAAQSRSAHERRVNRRLRGALAGVGVLLRAGPGRRAPRRPQQPTARRPTGTGRRRRPTSRTPGGPAPSASCTRTSTPCCSRSRRSRSTLRAGQGQPHGRADARAVPADRSATPAPSSSTWRPAPTASCWPSAAPVRGRASCCWTPPPSNPSPSRTTHPPAQSSSLPTATSWRRR